MESNLDRSALDLWKEKLEYYRREEAITSDPAKEFQLQQLIKECKQKIVQLEQEKKLSYQNLPNFNSPYRGLKKFEVDHQALFFGREQLVDKLVQTIETYSLILVLGASGSGKSSIIKAGLIPQLLKQFGNNLCYFDFTPYRDPFESFRHKLIDKGYKKSEVEKVLNNQSDTLIQVVTTLKEEKEQWLIFVDQFEELFTLCKDRDKQKIFLESLVKLAQSNNPSIKLVLAMRADFLDRFSANPKLVQIAHKEFVGDMYPDELKRAIEKPANLHGVVFEIGLVAEIIQDVRGQPGCLPLLQYTLNLLWEKDELSDQVLNIKTYRKIGGVRGALQIHVEEIYNKLTQEQKVITKQIFLRLIEIEELESLKKAINRRAYRSEFPEPSTQEVLQIFIDENLLVSNKQEEKQDSTVEIAHEILIYSWSTFKKWIEESQEIIIIRSRLTQDSIEWQNYKFSDENLWSGAKLQRVEELWKKKEFEQLGGLTELETKFIQAGIKKRNRIVYTKQLTFPVIAAFILGIWSFNLEQEQRYQKNIEAVFLSINSRDILQNLPSLLKRAKSEKNIDKKLAYYRQIIAVSNNQKLLKNSSEQDYKQLENYKNEARNNLGNLIVKHQLDNLKKELNKQDFGAFKSNRFTDLEQQYTPGALQTTYRLIMQDFGAGADLNSNGMLDKEEEEQIPCVVLLKIEKLWKEKNQKCSWSEEFSEPECVSKKIENREPHFLTLTAAIFEFANGSFERAVEKIHVCRNN